jgi:ABC-2 type transport system permease protein
MIGGFSMRRTRAIAHKEVRHILRDPLTMGFALGLPLVLVAFFGYAIDLDLRHIPVMHVNRDQTRASRQLIEVFNSSQFFQMSPAPAGDAVGHLDAGRARAVLMIEPGFGKRLAAGKSVAAQVLLDGVDSSTAGSVLGYLGGIERAANERLTGRTMPLAPLALQTRYVFNPELSSRWFVVPGLLVVVMSIMAIMLTAMTVAKEWETGSMELLLSTPVHPAEIVLGKLAPYLGLSFMAVAFVYAIARLLGVPFAGSHLLLILGCLLFLIPCLMQGLLISVATRQQQLAMQLSLMVGMLPSFMLSGFIFPVESMPLFFRILTRILSPRWFMVISRGIFLKDANIVELAGPLLALTAIAIFFTTLAVKRFKADMEP